MYGGTAATITIWGMGLPELAAIITAAVALLGAAVNVWYVQRKDRRAEEAHRLEMETLRAGTAAKQGRSSKDSASTLEA